MNELSSQGQKNQSVITLVACEHLDAQQVSMAQQIMQDFGCEAVHSKLWLEKERALDLFTTMPLNQAPALAQVLRENLSAVDVAVGRAAGRRKALLAADMDATILEGESLDDLAEYAGVKEQVAAITERAMQGELDFTAAVFARLELMKSLHQDRISDFVAQCRPNKGARTLIATMNKLGSKTMLLTGGFDVIAQPIAVQLGFDHLHCNQLTFDAQGYVAGTIKLPLVDSVYKNDALQAQAKAMGISLYNTLALGDGANDIPMIKSAGLGIAYYGKPSLRAQTPYQINHSDLRTALYFQGISDQQFALLD